LSSSRLEVVVWDKRLLLLRLLVVMGLLVRSTLVLVLVTRLLVLILVALVLILVLVVVVVIIVLARLLVVVVLVLVLLGVVIVLLSLVTTTLVSLVEVLLLLRSDRCVNRLGVRLEATDIMVKVSTGLERLGTICGLKSGSTLSRSVRHGHLLLRSLVLLVECSLVLLRGIEVALGVEGWS